MPLIVSDIPGLTALTQEQRRSPHLGNKFSLPASFDNRKYSGKWVVQTDDGASVADAEQPEVLPFAGVSADGWKVWKNDKNSPYTRVIGTKKYILMCRPKPLQTAVNSLYASQSRAIANQELMGETVQAKNVDDPGGVLTNKDLERARLIEDPNERPTPLPQSNGPAIRQDLDKQTATSV